MKLGFKAKSGTGERERAKECYFPASVLFIYSHQERKRKGTKREEEKEQFDSSVSGTKIYPALTDQS